MAVALFFNLNPLVVNVYYVVFISHTVKSLLFQINQNDKNIKAKDSKVTFKLINQKYTESAMIANTISILEFILKVISYKRELKMYTSVIHELH